HDRGAGYGITRVNRTTREITFEAWPIHADPEYPQTGSQFADWPLTIRQTDNDGRAPTGYLPVIDTHWRENPVVRVYDQSTNQLVHAMRVRGSRYRPPVYDNAATYRVEIAYGDEGISETLNGQTAAVAGPPALHYFGAVQPSILQGGKATLEWDVSSPATLTINQGIGNVMSQTIDGIGYLQVAPAADTTYTLTLNGTITAQTTVRVFPDRGTWDATHFTAAELADPATSGGGADPDGDGYTNDQEFQFQTAPRDNASKPRLEGRINVEGQLITVDFEMSYPVAGSSAKIIVETTSGLDAWQQVPANSYVETSRENFPGDGTSRVSIRLTETGLTPEGKRFYRGRWAGK
ncbi:MAG: hypothetical protein MUF04_10680, partial [Akkermansiaceae bacterium]|nr:hypothetical protein [Akkermansiaceae bacterium]